MSDNDAAFVRGNERLEALLSDSGRAARVRAAKETMHDEDRAHAMGLAAIRAAAKLTQTEIAQRLGVKQAAISNLESRDDILLSTLTNYLAAAGAEDITISAQLGGRHIEVAL